MTTKTDNALELAQWLGDGQGLLASLQELYGELWLKRDIVLMAKRQTSPEIRLIGQLIREAVEHFGKMPR